MSAVRWVPAYIGAGSNLDDPVRQVESGIAALAESDGIVLALRSGMYRSAPLGPQDQPDFVNAVVGVMTTLDVHALLKILQAIEDRHGRDRSSGRWGPRTLDLDLLSYSQARIEEPALAVPHPGIAERNFVLLPWRDIAPYYHVPGLGSVSALAGRVSEANPPIEKIA